VYIQVMKDVYKGGRVCVRMLGRVTNDFYVSMSLHQGSSLSPFPFT